MRTTGFTTIAALCMAACAGESAAPVAQQQALAAGAAAPQIPSNNETTPVLGCERASLLSAPADTSQRGPWPVGERTVSIGRLSAVEVFYPAQPGSDANGQPATFDLRTFLPQSEQAKIPNAEATILAAATYRDLPLDTAHGPYPAVIFVHGDGSFRVSSLSTLAMWASRGFVVIAADHPGMFLADYLAANGCGQLAPIANPAGDVDAELAALSAGSGALSFLAGRVDLQRVALAGHSSGAFNVAALSDRPGVQVVMELAGTRAISPASGLRSALFLGGMTDEVMPYASGSIGTGSLLYPGTSTDAYNGTAIVGGPRKRLIGIQNAGHLNLTGLCQHSLQGQPPLQAAQAHGVCGVQSVEALADCGTIEQATAVGIVNAATTAVLEETLQCQERTAVISGLPARFPQIGDFHERL